MNHNHAGHNHSGDLDNKKLLWAVIVNILLTLFQVVGGILSGSLSLLADALHNFSDAGALAIAAVAAKISKLPANEKMTFGYRRAEIIGALINSTTLVLVGVYLLYESVGRYKNQTPIDGWIVVYVAGIALVIDIATAFLTYSGSKSSINIRAAFIHNLSDAMASIVVIISGVLIIRYKIYIIDLVATVIISVYVLYQAFVMIKQCVKILMQSVPDGFSIEQIATEIIAIDNIEGVHHIHLWQLDDKKIFFEGHVVILEENLFAHEEIKYNIRELLKKKFEIEHTTLEIEATSECSNR